MHLRTDMVEVDAGVKGRIFFDAGDDLINLFKCVEQRLRNRLGKRFDEVKVTGVECVNDFNDASIIHCVSQSILLDLGHR